MTIKFTKDRRVRLIDFPGDDYIKIDYPRTGSQRRTKVFLYVLRGRSRRKVAEIGGCSDVVSWLKGINSSVDQDQKAFEAMVYNKTYTHNCRLKYYCIAQEETARLRKGRRLGVGQKVTSRRRPAGSRNTIGIRSGDLERLIRRRVYASLMLSVLQLMNIGSVAVYGSVDQSGGRNVAAFMSSAARMSQVCLFLCMLMVYKAEREFLQDLTRRLPGDPATSELVIDRFQGFFNRMSMQSLLTKVKMNEAVRFDRPASSELMSLDSLEFQNVVLGGLALALLHPVLFVGGCMQPWQEGVASLLLTSLLSAVAAMTSKCAAKQLVPLNAEHVVASATVGVCR